MSQNGDVRFVASSIKLPPFSLPPSSRHYCHPSSVFSSMQLAPRTTFPFNIKFKFNLHPSNFISKFLKNQRFFHNDDNTKEPTGKSNPFATVFRTLPLFCSASFAVTDTDPLPSSSRSKSGSESGAVAEYKGDDSGAVTQSKNVSSSRVVEEERVLISEVLVKSKDGEELERKDLEAEALNALKASRANSALTVREVQEDVHRIIGTGYFMSCMPVAVDTRDGIRLVFQVEPNQEFRGLVCEGANVLPSKFVEDAFHGGYGKTVNIRRLDEVISSINGWYMERGLFGMVSGVDILSGGIIKLQVSEAEVNNIAIRFLDKTGEPTVGKTRPETILRQLTTKKGQVYSMIQGKRDVETVLAMGVMDDVSMIPQPAGDTGKVDLTMNIVERKSGGGISGGGGISSGITSGPLAGLIGSIAIYHKNLFGRNQKLNLSLERGQIDSIFKINYTDPWIEGDDKRTSRAVMIQNSRTPGTLVHGNQPNNNGLTVGRITAGIEYGRPFRPKWNGTVGLVFQPITNYDVKYKLVLVDYIGDRLTNYDVKFSDGTFVAVSSLSLLRRSNELRAGAHDEKGNPIIRDFFGGPLTASGKTHDDMLLAKVETVYTRSGDPTSTMLVVNMDQGIPASPEWLAFNRVNARARQGFFVGPACFLVCLSGGHMVGKFPPHEAFPIGGTNSVRGYEEGAVGSGRSYVVGSGEISFPVMGQVSGAIFADYGTDLGSGSTVPGDPAGARNKAGSGYGYGVGIRVDSPLGPLRLEYAFNDQRNGRFHFGIGFRN